MKPAKDILLDTLNSLRENWLVEIELPSNSDSESHIRLAIERISELIAELEGTK